MGHVNVGGFNSSYDVPEHLRYNEKQLTRYDKSDHAAEGVY